MRGRWAGRRSRGCGIGTICTILRAVSCRYWSRGWCLMVRSFLLAFSSISPFRLSRSRFSPHPPLLPCNPYSFVPLHWSTALKTRVPFFLKPLILLITSAVESNYIFPNLKTQFDFLESQLATSPDEGDFLCGKTLTGADIMMSAPLGMLYFPPLSLCWPGIVEENARKSLEHLRFSEMLHSHQETEPLLPAHSTPRKREEAKQSLIFPPFSKLRSRQEKGLL